MNAKKKILAVALAASMAVLAVGGSSLAYFTDTETADNTFTVGNVDIQLDEPQWNASGKEEAQSMYPGEAVKKDPTVINHGQNPALVRIKIEWPTDVTVTYRTDYVDDKLGDGWELKGGYFYYNKPLNPGAKTDALFDQVVLDIGTQNGNGAVENIKVTAEAVQAQGVFPSYSVLEDGISGDNEWNAVIDFFEKAI